MINIFKLDFESAIINKQESKLNKVFLLSIYFDLNIGQLTRRTLLSRSRQAV